MHGEIVAILNRTAGTASDGVPERLAAIFAAAGKRARVLTAASGEEITAMARDAVAQGAGAVVAGGGDGTISAVASVLAFTDIPFGVLPLGTLNHFAKDLGIPLELEAAASVVVNGRATPVDAAEVNGRLFVNNSSLGLYPMLVRQRELKQALGYRKWTAFGWALITALRWYPFVTFRIEVNGKKMLRRTPFVFVGNNIYEMQGLEIGSRASITRGEMCVYVLHRTGRAGLALLALSALLGRLARAGNFDAFCTREVWIDSPRTHVQVALDGEVTALSTPLHYRIRPGALRVLLP